MVRKPYEKYTEVFIDAGQVNMFGVMKELVRNKYSGSIYPEHPRALDYDRERGPHPRLSGRRRLHRRCIQRGLRPGHAAGGAGILGMVGQAVLAADLPRGTTLCARRFPAVL